MTAYEMMKDALMQVSLSCSACPRHNCKGCTRPFASFMPAVRKALSETPRNCERFDDRHSAFEHFKENELWKYNTGLSPEYWFSEWIFEKEEKWKGGAK